MTSSDHSQTDLDFIDIIFSFCQQMYNLSRTLLQVYRNQLVAETMKGGFYLDDLRFAGF